MGCGKGELGEGRKGRTFDDERRVESWALESVRALSRDVIFVERVVISSRAAACSDARQVD